MPRTISIGGLMKNGEKTYGHAFLPILLSVSCLAGALSVAPVWGSSIGSRLGRTSDLGVRGFTSGSHRLTRSADTLHWTQSPNRGLNHRHSRTHWRDRQHRSHANHHRGCNLSTFNRHGYGSHHSHRHHYGYSTLGYPLPRVVVATTPFFCQPCGIGFGGESVFFSHVHRFHGVAFDAIIPSCVTVNERLIFLN